MKRVTIERLGHLGDGIAPGPIYAPLVLPGEVVEGEIIGDRLIAPRIIRPTAERVSAPCRHYRRCGGCSVQHASDEFVSAWKTRVIEQALGAVGLQAPVRAVHTSPPRARRRAALSGVRTKTGALVGFHARGSDTVVEVPECMVLHSDILGKWRAFEDLTQLGASRKHAIRLAVTVSLDGLDVAVEAPKQLDKVLWTPLVSIASDHDLARLSWNGEIVVERRPPRLQIGSAFVVPPPGAFLQATVDGEAALQRCVFDAVTGVDRILDLFCGVGTFTLDLARHATVHAVEGVNEMLRALDAGWRQAEGLKRITTEHRDLFRRPVEPSELRAYSAVVVDPPRAGAEAQMQALASGGPPKVAMVSCNPVSFARDTRILTDAGYNLEWIEVIDQFRWSAHVELAAALTR